jgi:hypothetical protein
MKTPMQSPGPGYATDQNAYADFATAVGRDLAGRPAGICRH